MPYFSIIIPVYNVAPYLRECLDSVLKQTFTDWEAICVDDGSTDDSGAILDEYAAKDKRFRVIHQANAGVGAARNAALDVATGEWVLFLDADDVWSKGCLETIIQVQVQEPTSHLIRFKSIEFYDCITFERVSGNVCVVTIDISSEISMSDIFDTLLWGYAYRRSVIGTRRFPPYKRGEDRVFLNGIQLATATKISAVENIMYGYRKRQGSAMQSIPSAQVIVDEMDHRRDIVLMIQESSKTVVYAGSPWLEKYFTSMVGRLIVDMPRKDHERLWTAWFKCVQEMRHCCGLSFKTKAVYQVCCALPCRPVWWFLCFALPWYNIHGVIPRGVRKMVRICKAVGGGRK